MDMSLVETTMLTAEEAHTQLQALGKAMLANGLAGTHKPSIETPMHRAVYEQQCSFHSIPGFVASPRPSTHLHPANGLFGRIIGPRHPLLPFKHPITDPVLTHADENVAQLLQGRMLSTLSSSLFWNLLPQFKQTPTAFRGQLSEQPFDFVQDPPHKLLGIPTNVGTNF